YYSKHKEIAQVISEKITTDHYSIDIEYNEEFIPFFDTIHSSSSDKNTEILSRTLSFMDQNIYGKKKITRINKRLANQYIKTKAIEKIVDSSNLNSYISQLASYETLIVNNEEFDNFFQIIDKISRNKDIMRDIATIEESIIHGDLTVDNIIV